MVKCDIQWRVISSLQTQDTLPVQRAWWHHRCISLITHGSTYLSTFTGSRQLHLVAGKVVGCSIRHKGDLVGTKNVTSTFSWGPKLNTQLLWQNWLGVNVSCSVYKILLYEPAIGVIWYCNSIQWNTEVDRWRAEVHISEACCQLHSLSWSTRSCSSPLLLPAVGKVRKWPGTCSQPQVPRSHTQWWTWGPVQQWTSWDAWKTAYMNGVEVCEGI